MAKYLASVVTAALAVYGASAQAVNLKQKPLNQYIKYTSVPGYFLQDSTSTNQTTFDFIGTNFGLINRTYEGDEAFQIGGKKSQWERFANEVYLLNYRAPKNVQYKVLFIGRHGDGLHNDAESFFGTPAWNCYYAQLNGNDTATWRDAHLSEAGIEQAKNVNKLWQKMVKTQNIQTPQSYYTSPMTRCLQTAFYSFDGLEVPAEFPFIPEVKELLREGIDIHTCDSRSTLSYIKENFPSYTIEPGFTEHDLLFRNSTSETPSSQGLRSKTLLDQLFQTDGNTFLSLTTHSGEGASLLSVLNHIPFSLSTGAVIPVLVKAETVPGPGPTTTVLPYTSQVVCSGPPKTSLATGGCVCSPGQTVPTGLAR